MRGTQGHQTLPPAEPELLPPTGLEDKTATEVPGLQDDKVPRRTGRERGLAKRGGGYSTF